MKKLHIVANDKTDGHERYDDVYFEYRADQIISFSEQNGVFIFRCKNDLALQISILSKKIFRIRYAINGKFARDFSYAIDPKFKSKKTNIKFTDTKNNYVISTSKLSVYISKKNLKLRFKDHNGKIINQDKKGFYAKSTLQKGICHLSISKKTQKGEYFFGLGDKSCSLNLTGKTFENWATDAFAYKADTDPLYRAIPFFYGLTEGKAYGIFFDNTHKTHYDFNSKKNNETLFSAEGGEINYYFIYGPKLLAITQQYALITGTAELPPIWALGFQQCRWSYYPESRVKELAAEFRKREIPCDAIYLDIDYMEEYKCFTWNKKYFPNLKQMTSELKADGFNLVVMIDPGIKVDDDYSIYQEGLGLDAFCRRTNGELMVGPVWPPRCVWPDYTNPKVRKWFGNLYRELYNEINISGFWNDMNEPAVFKLNSKTFPDEVLHHYEAQQCTHKEAHNIYGMQMSRSTYEGLKKLKPKKRPLVITRASYAGGQRFASVWTGDNIASWEHLKIGNIQCQRMSISGFSFVGTDIGGFVDQPDGELFVRWLQLGIFHPFYRIHSIGNKEDGAVEVDENAVAKSEKEDRMDQEPWSFGKAYTAWAKQAIELRYKLLGYLYTCFWQHRQTGLPVIRPYSFVEQNNILAIENEDAFFFGDQLFVHPILAPNRKKQKVFLPKGDWYYFWNGKKYKGGHPVSIKTKMNQIPFFVKAGTVLPLYPIRQNTTEKVDTLFLKVYASNKNTRSFLYEDEGDHYNYLEEQFALSEFIVKSSSDKFSLSRKQTGEFKPVYNQIVIEIFGLDFRPSKCIVDGEELGFRIVGKKVIEINCSKIFLEVTMYQSTSVD